MMDGLYIIFARDLGKQQYIIQQQPAGERFAPGQRLAWKVEPVANPHEEQRYRSEGWRIYQSPDYSDQVAVKAFALVFDDGRVRPFRKNTNAGRAQRVNELLLFAELEGEQAREYYANRLQRFGVELAEDGPRSMALDFQLLWKNHARITEGMLADKFPHSRTEVPDWMIP